MQTLLPKSIENKLVFNSTKTKITNEYVIKEYRRTLLNQGFSGEDIENSLSLLRKKMTILPTPAKDKFQKIDLTDKSDKPIVYSAKTYPCTLVTNDRRTY